MKSYETSIAYMRREMVKQTKPHRRPYLDAIKAMERLNPTEAERKGAYIVCPYCGKEYTHRNKSELERGERVCNFCGQHMKWGGVADDRID